MPKPSASTTDRRWKAEGWLPALVFTLLLLFSFTGLWTEADRALSDLLLRVRVATAPLPLNPRIFPVDLNDRAERNLGNAVGSRQAFADLFRVLGDGKLGGGMDFLFAGSKDPAGDRAMAESAALMDGLVLAVVPVDKGVTQFSGQALSPEEEAVLKAQIWHPVVVNAGTIPVADTFLMPALAFAQASRYLGHIGVRPDNDGLYRKSLLFFRWGDGYMPSLSLALAAFALKVEPSKVLIDAGHQVVLPVKDGAIRIPIDDQGFALIPYPAVWGQTWKRTPLDKVVAAAADVDQEDALLSLWDGGLVVAADLTTAHKDFGPTPIETIYPLSGIHTSLLNGILTGTFFAFPNPWWQALLALVLLAVVFVLSPLKKAWVVHLGFGLLLVALAAWALVWWFAALTVPWFAAPAAALVGAWLAATLIRLFQAHEERTLMESALSRYFPRALASRVLDEKTVDLAPASKDLTLLFADIAGFTKWSSDKSPDLVHGFLSDYLESMAHILFAHGGTVDKFMGDGILAFFGDPFEQPDHAQRCIKAALAMQAKVQELRGKWEGPAGIDLKIRIGINSGTVIAGNLGSITRIEYTVIGAAVNIAQRMESNAPVGGILVTEETWSRTKDLFRFSAPREVVVKGYTEGLKAYVVEG